MGKVARRCVCATRVRSAVVSPPVRRPRSSAGTPLLHKQTPPPGETSSRHVTLHIRREKNQVKVFYSKRVFLRTSLEPQKKSDLMRVYDVKWHKCTRRDKDSQD